MADTTNGVWVKNTQTGNVHLTTPENAAYLIGSRDPLTGTVLFEEGSEPATPKGYSHDDPDTHGRASQTGDGAALPPAVVHEAAYGVPDDAITTDAAAMAERGGQPKGSVAGPTIPQEARTDREARRAVGNPLALGEVADGEPAFYEDAVRPDVAARHAAGMNMPDVTGESPKKGSKKGAKAKDGE